MNSRFLAIVLATLSAATTTLVMGQQEKANSGSRRGSTSVSRGRTTSAPRTTASTPTVSRTSVGNPAMTTFSRGTSGGSSYDRPTLPRRAYSPSVTDIYPGARYLTGVNFGNWSRGYWFLMDLGQQYRSVSRGSGLWRMATGVSPLTANTLRLSTRTARSAAEDLLTLSVEIDTLIDDYEAGRITRKVFRDAVEDQTDLIRKHSKTIRKDRLLDYVDVRKNKKTAKAERARSLEGLRDLSAALRVLALELRDSLGEYTSGELAQVVSLNHLERPSVDTLSKGIDSLAKTIEKSADKL